MDDIQAAKTRLAELVEYTKTDLAEREPDTGQHVHIHHHYPPATPPAPVGQMDIASKYAGHFVLLLGGMIVMAGVTVVFVMVAQALMIAMISTAVCAMAMAGAMKSMRDSATDSKIMKQRLDATKPKRGRR
jgi:hypothetical protein